MKRQLALITAALLSSSAMAIDMQEASSLLVDDAKIVDIKTLESAELESYSKLISASLNGADDKVSYIQRLFENNAEYANIVYTVAINAGIDEDTIIATALRSGVDPSVMLEPTALAFGPPPPPPGGGVTLPPPPPPIVIGGGGGGGGGVSVSQN